MKKLFYLVIILVLGILFLASYQLGYIEEDWYATYNGPANSIDNAQAIAVDSSGNVYVTGGSDGSGTDCDYATIAYDSSGNQLWVARYDGPANLHDYARAIAVDLSGNVYVTGGSDGSGTDCDYATIAYDSSGNQLWVARYDGPANLHDYARAIAVDLSGNVYVTGWSEGSGTHYDYDTIAYDSSGNQLWVARYDGPANLRDYAEAITVNSSGNVYVTGGSIGSGTHCDYATIAYDSSGNQLWVARYNGPENLRDYTRAIATGPSGNVYVTGWSNGGMTRYDYATVAYDGSGNQLWVARYDGPSNYRDYAQAIAVDLSENVYVTGWSQGVWGLEDASPYDYATVAYDGSGNQLWVARYDGPASFRDYAQAIAVDSSGSVYVGGGSFGSGTSYDCAALAYDGSGNQLWVARYNGPANVDDYGEAIAVDSSGNVYMTGWINTTGYSDYVTVKYLNPSAQIKLVKNDAGNLVTAGELNQRQSNALIDMNSYQSEIERINHEIKLQGLKWQAGETPISKLSYEERKLRLDGFVPSYAYPAKYAKVEKTSILPSSLDWRSKDGRNYMTSVKEQTGCGSCWAFAVLGTMEAMYNAEKGIAGTEHALQYPNFSDQELVSCSNCGDCAGGPRWNPGLCAEYIKYNGIVNEGCFPYVREDVPCDKCYDWSEKRAFITDWSWVTQGTANKDAIINALQDGPLSFWMEIYEDFYSYVGGIYEPTALSQFMGPHKVVLVGYNEDEDYWICKNSWGEDWGDDGYFKIKMGVCGTGIWVLKLWGVSIDDNPPVLTSEIGDQTIKEGQEFSIQLSAYDSDDDPLTFSAYPKPFGASMNNGAFSWTPNNNQSGEYYIRFSVNDSQLEDFEDVKITVLDVFAEQETGKKKGCFVATAAYDSPLHSHVRILRTFRDKYLISNKLGRQIVDIYYNYSPSVANFIKKHKIFKVIIRISLLPVVAISYLLVEFGLTITSVVFGFVFLLPIFFVWFYRKKLINLGSDRSI